MSQSKQLRTRVDKLEEQMKLVLEKLEKDAVEKHEEGEKKKNIDEDLRVKIEKERRRLVEELREARERELTLKQERDKEHEARLLLDVEMRKQREYVLKVEQERIKLEAQCDQLKRRLGEESRLNRKETAMMDVLDQMCQSIKCMNLLNLPHKRENQLSYAVKTGNVEAVQLLLSLGTDITNGDSLNCAVRCGNLEMCELLLQSGVQVNARSLDNCTPLHVAALRGDAIMVKLLLKWKADVNMSHFDLTPSELARQAGHNMVAEYLAEIEKGVRPIPSSP